MRDSRCVPAFPRMGFAWALYLFLGAQVGLFGQTGKGGGNSDTQSGPEAALTNGLWAHYPLDGNASDNSGNGHHGESNQTQLTHDRFGRPNRAFDFDGNNSAVYLPIGSEFNSSVDSLSVSLWAKVRDSSRGTLFEQGTEFNKGRDILSFRDNNLTSKLGGGAIFVKKLPEMNVWRHYLITYEVSMGAAQRKFYVDGQLFGSDSNDTLENSSLNFMLGLDVLANFPFDGAMDSVRIWRRALSAVQVAALYQIESANPTPPKVEVSGSVSYDGVVPGPIRVLAYRPNGNLAAQTLLSSGESAFSLSLTDNRSYDLFAFQDRDDNGSYNAYLEPGDHYGDWNKSSQSFGLLSVEGDRAGIQLHLTDLDSDEDGYENWYEYQAGTAINDPESIPGIGFGLMGRWRIRGEFNATIEDSAGQKAEATLRNENNASARYYEVGHRPGFLLDSGAVTIFFKHDSITGRQGYLSKDARGLKNGGHVSIYQIDGNLTARLQSASKSYSIQVPDCIVPNRWNHLVFQWGPGGMTLWLNGQSVGSDPYAGGLGSTSGGSGNEEPLFIGAGGWKYEDEDPSTVVGFFDGEVHLALLHSRKLTPLEIASHVHTSKILVNRRPYGLTLDQNQISENQSAGTLLGVLSAMDDDYNANLTYALNYNGQGGPFAVQSDGTVVTTRPIDYEETPQLELFARVSDEYDAKQWKKIVIEVLDLDEVPDTEESPGPQAPGSDKEGGENDPTGESPKSEESDGGKGPDTSSPETESEKEPASPSNPQGEGEHPGQGEESPGPQMPGSDKQSGENDPAGESPKSEESDGGKGQDTSSPETESGMETPSPSNPQGEGEHPGRGDESPGPQMPGSDKQSGENDPAGESPRSEESDGGKSPDTSSPETESGKEPASPSNPQGEGEHPGQGEESPGPQIPGSDKESGENDPAGESPKSEESDGGKGPDTSSPETESEKEPSSPSNPQGEGKKPGKGEESAGPQMPGSDKERGEGDSDKRPGKPGSEKEDDLSKQPGKPSDSEESDLEKGEGKKPGKGEESAGPQMPGSDKERGEGDSDKRPGKPGSEKEDDLSKQPGKPSDSEESDLEKGEGKKPGKDKEETDSQLPEKESVKPEEEESKNGKKARLPIVRTLRFDRDENGTFVLAGKVLADGGGTLEEVGILISEKFSFKDCECKPAEIKGKEGIFRKRLRKLEAGATYYYRAYARNEVGENWGSIRKLKVPKVEERKAWWSESLEMGGGWRQSEWLGAFRKSEGNDWIFHLKLGWVFARPDSSSGLWLWLEEYGWLWTQKDAWPYLWANQSADWLYFVTQLRGEALFLRPSDGQLILQGREFRTGSEKQRETEPSGKEEFTKEPGRSSDGKEKTKRETDQTHPATDERKTQDSAGTSGKQRDVQERGEVARESVTERNEGKSEREEPGDLGREETISQPGKREEGKERATDDSTLGKQTEHEISERPEMERESMTDRTADEGPVSDRISGETERDGKVDREQTGNRQTISENRQDLPLEREDLSRERNSESTLILERSERSEP